MTWEFLLIYTHLSMFIKFHQFKMLPFLKHISSSNYMFIEICTVLFLKINSHVKKNEQKMKQKWAARHCCPTQQASPFTSSMQWKSSAVSGKHKWITRNRLACCLCIQEGKPSSFPQTVLNLSAWDICLPSELSIKLKNSLAANIFPSLPKESLWAIISF